MSYRPICDTWILARPKVAYHGAYPSGFLHRARALLGVGPLDCVLHVCAGRVRDYPYRGLGPRDLTLDVNPALEPDIVHDVTTGIPEGAYDAILIDRPYTAEDARQYGDAPLPELNALLKASLQRLPVGRRVGTLDYKWPHPGKLGLEVAVVGVGCGRNQNARWFCVYERVAT